MSEVYANYLPLKGDPERAFATAGDLARRWVAETYEEERLPGDGDTGEWKPVRDVSVSWSELAAPATRNRLWTLTWRRKDPDDDTLLRRTAVRVGLEKERAWLAIREALTPIGATVLPLDLRPRRPQIVGAVLRVLEVERDGRLIGTEAETVGVAEAPQLIELLEDRERRLPAVVISLDQYAGRPLLDPEALADVLAGLAHVFVIEPAATFALSDAVDKERSVFYGAVRVYWPGFTRTARLYDHPLWLPDRIREFRRPGPTFADALAGEVIRVAIVRIPPPPLERKIHRELAAEREREVQRLRDEARLAAVDPAWQEEMQRAWDEEDRLRREIERLAAENVDLSERLEAALASRSGDERGPRTVRGAVELAAERCSNIEFLPSALESAAESPYRQPEKVLLALERIDDIAGRFAADNLQGGLRAAFEDAGLQYGADISDTAKTQFRREYERRYAGRVVLLGPHVRLGTGPPHACARIYWFVDEDRRRFVIGHVGKHLRDTNT